MCSQFLLCPAAFAAFLPEAFLRQPSCRRRRPSSSLPGNHPRKRQHMRNGNIELAWDFSTELQTRERGGECGVFLQRDFVLACRFDDAIRDLAAALGDDARSTATAVVQRDGERRATFAHARRSNRRVGRAP